MDANDFERILTRELLRSQKDSPSEHISYECLDPEYLRAQNIQTRLTTRLRSREFSKSKDNPYASHQSFSAKQDINDEPLNETFKHGNQNTKSEPSYSTDELPMLERIYLKEFVKLGATDHLFVSISKALLKSEFRRLALKYHPDHGGSAENFQALKDAFDALESWTYSKD